MMHVTDWLPTFVSWSHSPEMTKTQLNTDGFDFSEVLNKEPNTAIQNPRNEILLDMYYPGEAIWDGEGVVALRSGRWKFIQGIAREPVWYSHPNTRYLLNSTDNSWPVYVGQLLVQVLSNS